MSRSGITGGGPNRVSKKLTESSSLPVLVLDHRPRQCDHKS